MLVHRILSFALYSTKIGYNISVFQQQMLTLKPSREVLTRLMDKYSYGEWFFLQTLATNLDGELAVQLLEAIAKSPKMDDNRSISSSSANSSPGGYKDANLKRHLLQKDDVSVKDMC